MRKGLLIIALAVGGLLTACGGQAGQLPQDYVTYGFDTRVDVATSDPTPGRRVDLTVAVTSIGNAPVHCDVILHVVADNGDDLYDQRWDDMLFMPQAQWDLSQGFLPPATDIQKSYHLQVEVRRHDTGELMEQNLDAGTLAFSGT